MRITFEFFLCKPNLTVISVVAIRLLLYDNSAIWIAFDDGVFLLRSRETSVSERRLSRSDKALSYNELCREWNSSRTITWECTHAHTLMHSHMAVWHRLKFLQLHKGVANFLSWWLTNASFPPAHISYAEGWPVVQDFLGERVWPTDPVA